MVSFDLFAFDNLDVTNPSAVLSYGGWESFGWVFANSEGVLYAVDPSSGNLVRFRGANDNTLSGGVVIGRGGWHDLTLFSATDGFIYAVDPSAGNLLRYANADVVGDGALAGPTVIGRGGWNAFSFLFSGDGGQLFAAESMTGNLRRYSHVDTAGDGQAAAHEIIGFGGWADFVVLVYGGDGNIFGVRPDGELVRYSNVGTAAELANPQHISNDWTDFLQVLATRGRLLAIGPGPSRPGQQLQSVTINFNAQVDRVHHNLDFPFETTVTCHLATALGPIPGIVNLVSVSELEGSTGNIVHHDVLLGTVDREISISSHTRTAKFRGLDGRVPPLLRVITNGGQPFDLFQFPGSSIAPVHGSIDVSFWASDE